MALKALMLRKSIDTKKKALEELRQQDAEFETRESELTRSIEEAETDEERSAVEEAVGQYESDNQAHQDAKAALEREISELETELAAEEARQEAPAPTPETREETRVNMETRKFCNMNAQERDTFFAREDVKEFLGRVRTAIKEKRALTNVGLTIPQVMLGLLRENIEGYSKLYKHVNVRQLTGTGRMNIMGTIPEGVWTEMCATLNELDLSFNDVEVDGYKVGGFFAVCNAVLEDSDLDLASELMTAIGQAIGRTLDKAILYGTGTKMPLGIVTRLAQTEAPTDYPATARTWVDLHSTNIQSITAANSTGIKLFQNVLADAGAAKGKYARGEKTWVMNETTYTKLQVEGMSINAAGTIVSGMNSTMPVLGGAIEILSFVPDNVIIGGYFDLYLLAERRGIQLSQSEHYRFLEDQTVFKGTARYDGVPVIAEGFVAIGISGTTPNATMTFAEDTANS